MILLKKYVNTVLIIIVLTVPLIVFLLGLLLILPLVSLTVILRVFYFETLIHTTSDKKMGELKNKKITTPTNLVRPRFQQSETNSDFFNFRS